MQAKIALISIFTDNLAAMVRFYRDVLGFEIELQLERYVEFASDGVRFAICARSVLAETTGHPDYNAPRRGQPFGLAFPVDSPAAVDGAYGEIVEKGATPIKVPAEMPWGQRTGFFADPDGNIHELFADLPDR